MFFPSAGKIAVGHVNVPRYVQDIVVPTDLPIFPSPEYFCHCWKRHNKSYIAVATRWFTHASGSVQYLGSISSTSTFCSLMQRPPAPVIWSQYICSRPMDKSIMLWWKPSWPSVWQSSLLSGEYQQLSAIVLADPYSADWPVKYASVPHWCTWLDWCLMQDSTLCIICVTNVEYFVYHDLATPNQGLNDDDDDYSLLATHWYRLLMHGLVPEYRAENPQGSTSTGNLCTCDWLTHVPPPASLSSCSFVSLHQQ